MHFEQDSDQYETSASNSFFFFHVNLLAFIPAGSAQHPLLPFPLPSARLSVRLSVSFPSKEYWGTACTKMPYRY